MFFAIVSREEAEWILQNKPKDKLAQIILISIINPSKIKKRVNKNNNNIVDSNFKPLDENLLNKVHDHLTVSFWDLEEPFLQYRPISEKEAMKIAAFIFKHKNKIGNGYRLLIHCSAGKSRSAGVGLAAKCIVKHNGDKMAFSLYPCDIYKISRYSPNLKVFNEVVKAFNKLKGFKK